jgi:hypothetical protein
MEVLKYLINIVCLLENKHFVFAAMTRKKVLWIEVITLSLQCSLLIMMPISVNILTSPVFLVFCQNI